MRSVEEVDEIIPCKPPRCRHCQRPLTGEDPHYRRHQVLDLPPIQPVVREYQLHTLTCSHCRQTTTASLPDGVPASQCGPRLQAVAAVCTGVYHLSKRQTQDLLHDCFGSDLSLGSLSNLEQRVSEALVLPVAEVQQALADEPVVHADETRWPQGNGRQAKGYLWVAVTAALALFLVRPGRDQRAARELLGEHFRGVLVSDRYASYHWVSDQRRQFCWAHLRREWQAFAERGGDSAVLGQRLGTLTDEMFRWWHKLREREWTWRRFQGALFRMRRQVHALLVQGCRCAQTATAGTCAELLRHEEALWTFGAVEGVEPTNNRAEQAVRPAVLWRHCCFGTRSEGGSRYVERMLTVVTTCRLQGRNVLEYMTATCTAALAGGAPPSLLPKTLPCPSRN